MLCSVLRRTFDLFLSVSRIATGPFGSLYPVRVILKTELTELFIPVPAAWLVLNILLLVNYRPSLLFSVLFISTYVYT